MARKICVDQDIDRVVVPMQFAQLTRECDVRFFTGLESTATFKTLFDFLLPRSSIMSYWEGLKGSSRERASNFQERLDMIIGSPVYGPDSVLPIN